MVTQTESCVITFLRGKYILLYLLMTKGQRVSDVSHELRELYLIEIPIIFG